MTLHPTHRPATHRRSALTALALGVLVLGLPATGRAAETAPAGQVAALQGQAEATLANDPRALAPKDAVFVGDDVATADKSRLELRLGADTTLRMGALTRIRIDAFLADAGGEITLDDGALLVDKDPASAARPLEVNSAFGRIAVRGTEFFAGPSRGVFGVFLARGKVDVTAAGVTVTLTAGEGTDIARPGAPPSPPARWGAPRIAEALASVR